MRRVSIHGSPGAGKSTLAKAIAKITPLPVIHLDRIFWNDNWQLRPKEESINEVKNAVDEENWIIEGLYNSSYGLRMERADTIIFIDLPRIHLLFRVAKRVIKNWGDIHPDMPQGCPEKFDWSFMMDIWNSTKKDQIRDKIQVAINKSPESARIVHLKSDVEIAAFLQSIIDPHATLPSS